MRSFQITLLCGTTVLAACAANTGTQPGDDELAGESDADGSKADANALQDTFGIYSAMRVGVVTTCNDLSPVANCAHVELSRANRSTTTCADGKDRSACAVHSLDYSKLSLSASVIAHAEDLVKKSNTTPSGPPLLMRGNFIHGTDPSAPGADWITFQVTELWVAAVPYSTLSGTYVMMRDLHRECIVAPCAQLNEARLNSARQMDIDAIDWDYNDATANDRSLIDQVATASKQPDGVIILGDRTHGADSSTLRTVSQVYLNAK